MFTVCKDDIWEVFLQFLHVECITGAVVAITILDFWEAKGILVEKCVGQGLHLIY